MNIYPLHIVCFLDKSKKHKQNKCSHWASVFLLCVLRAATETNSIHPCRIYYTKPNRNDRIGCNYKKTLLHCVTHRPVTAHRRHIFTWLNWYAMNRANTDYNQQLLVGICFSSQHWRQLSTVWIMWIVNSQQNERMDFIFVNIFSTWWKLLHRPPNSHA